MFKKLFASFALTAALACTDLSAQVVIRVGPPRSVAERRPPPPGRSFIWTPGYQNWNGNAYGWVPGRWQEPPRGNRRWEKHHWVRRNGGWVLVEGRWR